MNSSKKIIIAGAGLVGSLLACYLSRQGYQVDMFEKRDDMRKKENVSGKSINMALSPRGILPLKELGLIDDIIKISIPMKGRLIHTLDDKTSFQPYGKDDSEVINSVSRAELNKLLLTAAESIEQGKVNIKFNHEVIVYTMDKNILTVLDHETGTTHEVTGEIIISAEGAGSNIRYAMQKLPRFNLSQQFLTHGYKELEIPPNEASQHQIEKNVLHIWPRKEFMLIALPNPDGSFTATLFLPFEGKNGFQSLNNEHRLVSFFKTYFKDIYPLMSTLQQDFFNNPTGILGTIKCDPWYYRDKTVLIGDAAHAIVPFYGQGMNAGFEDCRIFNDLITKYKENWNEIFPRFTQMRKANTDAIADMALDNFIEMRDRVADRHFLLIKEAEHLLYTKYPDIISKYSMVTFRPHIPYTEARKKGDILLSIIKQYCEGISSINDFDVQKTYKCVKEVYSKL